MTKIDLPQEGEYLALYNDSEDIGNRCGYSDSELAAIKTELAKRGLTLTADDRGLLVVTSVRLNMLGD